MIIINNKYLLSEQIGRGMYGIVYKGKNIRTNESVAIKIERIDCSFKFLKNEAIIYNFLLNIPGIPNLKWFGKDEVNYYIVISLLGETLSNLKINNMFAINIILKIGIQMIKLLQLIHNKGIVHRDIKPDNFIFGINEFKDKLYLIDFGISKTFIKNGLHKEIKKTHNLIGSLNYCSINSHNYVEISRRDDLESVGYILIFLCIGYLKWNNIKNYEEIKKLKEEIFYDENIPNIIKRYLKIIRLLKYEETPNYSFYINILKNEIERK